MSASGPSGPLVFFRRPMKIVAAMVMAIVKMFQKRRFRQNSKTIKFMKLDM